MYRNIKSLKKKVLTFTIAGAILVSPMIVSAELGDQILSKGIKTNDVKVLQQHLKDLNYLEINELDIVYDELTEKAVIKFQKDNGLDADGAFGEKTFNALNNALTKQLGEKLVLAYNDILKDGSKGNDVTLLQESLKNLGFLNIDKLTDTYGPAVKKAVQDFQSTYNLDVDGIAGRETFITLGKVLKGEIKKSNPKTVVANTTSGKGSQIVASARTHLGKPYSYGASNGSSFDCSGFTQYVFRQNGISIPRTTEGQAVAGNKVGRSDLQVGDLVIFNNTYKPGPSHAGIYIGEGKFIHASSNGKGVTTSSLNESYYSSRFASGRRFK